MGVQQIQRALQLVGNEHKYQKIIIILISLAWVQFNFVLLGSTFIYEDPSFQCIGSDQRISQSQAFNTFTLTSQLKLYCDLQWARNIIQSIVPLGSIAGLLVMNFISDIKGRKISIIICLYLSVIGVLRIVYIQLQVTIIAGHYKIVYLAIIAQFINGFGIYLLVPLSYTVLTDFCSMKFKSKAIIAINTAWSVCTILLGFIYLLQINWFIFTSFMALLPLIGLTLLVQKFLYQPPFILMNQNKKQQALQILLKVAKINNTYDDNHLKIKQIIQNQQFTTHHNKPSLKNIFKIIFNKSGYLKTIIVLSAILCLGSINFYGTSYAFSIYGLGLGYNCIFAGIMEILAFIFLMFFIDKIPRRKGISLFFLCVSAIGLLFLFPFIADNNINGTILMAISRFFSTIYQILIVSAQTQAFTAQIRSTAIGFIECFGLLGAMVGPLIVDWSQQIGINSITAIAITVSIAIWLPIFLRQTQNKNKEVQDCKQKLLQTTSQ